MNDHVISSTVREKGWGMRTLADKNLETSTRLICHNVKVSDCFESKGRGRSGGEARR